ncbi:MAG: YqhA family protein [Methylocystis sp.]|uniref:YqhA family protein n=1 Tax=Methylocystis sp. TaxID=1911079 RepID=UPI003D10F717
MFKRLIENYIFFTRWLLLPFIFMLGVGLVGMALTAANSTYHLIQMIFSENGSNIKIHLLELVDLTLISALVVIVTISIYGNFVYKINDREDLGRPAWMASVDFSQLKLNLLTTIVVISAVRLLEVFLEVPKLYDSEVYHYIALHLTLVFSRLAMAYSPKNAAKE